MVRLYSWICWMISSSSLSVMVSKSANVSVCSATEKHSRQHSANCLKAQNVTVHNINLSQSLSYKNVPGSFQTWGSRAWILAALTQWKSSPGGGLHCSLEAKWKLYIQYLAQLLWGVLINHSQDTWDMFEEITIHRIYCRVIFEVFRAYSLRPGWEIIYFIMGQFSPSQTEIWGHFV